MLVSRRLCALVLGLVCSSMFGIAQQEKASPSAPFLRHPIFVYNNWSSYDELSDRVPLTETLALRELDELLRLRRQGVRFDAYMMDAFWFAPDGAYRKWRTPNWPEGPERWIRKCRENGLLPGLWFGSNALVMINAAPEWQDSLDKKRNKLSFSEGGFLPHFMETLQYWYDRGIRMFKFDFVDFSAATPEAEKKYTAAEIRARNVDAFREALRKFRQKNPDAVLVAFNGFGGDLESTAGPFPFRDPVDARWLEIFDALYSGDPRPSDVPQMNFWRAVDIYSDHMIRRYEQSGIPLVRLDSTAFMVGNTGTIYYRKTNAWKGMALLTLARGGWVNTIHGNLEFIADQDARWLAKVQSIYLPLQAAGETHTFGGIPGEMQPYGFVSLDLEGAIYSVVNPGQSVQQLVLPRFSQRPWRKCRARLLFRDAGFIPTIAGDKVELGAGQLAVIGYGKYANANYELGVQEDVRVPRAITPLQAEFSETGKNTVAATVLPIMRGSLRIVVQQHAADGSVLRTWGGGPPDGKNVGQIFVLRAAQNGRAVPIEIDYDKVVWSGLSWAVGEIKSSSLQPGVPVNIQCFSAEEKPVRLRALLFQVEY